MLRIVIGIGMAINKCCRDSKTRSWNKLLEHLWLEGHFLLLRLWDKEERRTMISSDRFQVSTSPPSSSFSLSHLSAAQTDYGGGDSSSSTPLSLPADLLALCTSIHNDRSKHFTQHLLHTLPAPSGLILRPKQHRSFSQLTCAPSTASSSVSSTRRPTLRCHKRRRQVSAAMRSQATRH